MKFRKFTATIALTAVLSSSIASSLTPLTVLATDGEDTATTEVATEEFQNSEPVQENNAPAEPAKAPSEQTAEPAENKVEETKQEEQKESKTSNDGSSSSDAEPAGKEGSKASDEQGTSEITTVEPDTEEHANEEIASKEEASSSEASTEASRETASASEEEKTYTLSFESLCGDESLGSGSVSLKLSNDYITIESGEPHYPDCELVSTEVAGYTLSDGKLSGADDANPSSMAVRT